MSDPKAHYEGRDELNLEDYLRARIEQGATEFCFRGHITEDDEVQFRICVPHSRDVATPEFVVIGNDLFPK